MMANSFQRPWAFGLFACTFESCHDKKEKRGRGEREPLESIAKVPVLALRRPWPVTQQAVIAVTGLLDDKRFELEAGGLRQLRRIKILHDRARLERRWLPQLQQAACMPAHAARDFDHAGRRGDFRD